ncbi:MAG: GTPase ObgE, partial [Myxococcota bacterium]
MQFVDEVLIDAIAGDGGNGCVAFRREKFLPLGGPSGGDGGRGGDVVIVAEERYHTLLDLQYRRVFRAQRGEDGRGKDQYGKGGRDAVLPVPVGTQVYDAETDELLADLSTPGERHVIARGGHGGRGNIHFASSKDRAPRRAGSGGEGEKRALRLELKLIADVGVVGFPNVGKSTFIAAVSRAKPKIADYPFTTLTPNLGVVSLGTDRSFVVADVPGIIEGAAEGAGLGLRFLRHVERNRILLHVLSVDPDPEREPLRDLAVMEAELARFSPTLASRPTLVALSKADLPEVKALAPALAEALAAKGKTLHVFSAATGEGVQPLLIALERGLAAHPRSALPAPVTPPRAGDRPHGDAKGCPTRPDH